MRTKCKFTDHDGGLMEIAGLKCQRLKLAGELSGLIAALPLNYPTKWSDADMEARRWNTVPGYIPPRYP